MVREIKFRAWDIQNERMVYDPDRFEPAYNDEKSVSDWIFYETWQDREDGIRRACYIMQYTGLHDKHGKEIYEGDIIVHEGEHKVIDFKGGSFGIDHQPTPRKPHERILSSTSWEVIGNIYQNPELI